MPSNAIDEPANYPSCNKHIFSIVICVILYALPGMSHQSMRITHMFLIP